MQKKNLNYWLLIMQTVFTVFIAMFLIFYPANAQSGRRTPPVNTPTPSPTPETQPTVIEPKQVKAQYSFRVMSNIPQNIYMEFTRPENMHGWVIERLKTSLLLDVESGGSANRKEAIAMAKSSDQTFMILLELDENNFASSNGSVSKAKQGEVWINYFVFTPGTGKTKSSGRAVLRSEGQTIGILGKSKQRLCYPNVFGDDYLLLGASFEAAERIIASFNLPIPPVC